LTDERLADLREADARAVAFRQLADEHLDRSYRLAYVILRDVAEAQDATHDAFVTAWRRWGTLRDASRFQSWFDRILVNTCRHRLRDKSRHRTSDLSTVLASPHVATPDRVPAQAEARDVIAEAVGSLSADHRIVLALRFSRDLSVAEIAHRLGVRTGTVKSRLHYALRRVRETIESQEISEASR